MLELAGERLIDGTNLKRNVCRYVCGCVYGSYMYVCGSFQAERIVRPNDNYYEGVGFGVAAVRARPRLKLGALASCYIESYVRRGMSPFHAGFGSRSRETLNGNTNSYQTHTSTHMCGRWVHFCGCHRCTRDRLDHKYDMDKFVALTLALSPHVHTYKSLCHRNINLLSCAHAR